MKVFASLVFAILGVWAMGPNPGRAASPPLPLDWSGTEWRPLSQRWDQRLQARLDQALKQHKAWQSLIDAGKMGVGLVDLSDPEAPRYARVNGDTTRYAASLPKLAVLLAAFQGFEDGTLKETPQIHRDLIDMIRRSSNSAAHRLIERIGLKRIEAVSRDRRYRFYDPQAGGGIWVGGAYAHGAQENPEPMTGLLYTASVNQICRFYYLLAWGRLISPERSRQMLKILSFPDITDKFVVGLKGAVPLNRLYRKSGEWKIWHSDSILVWGETWRRYILVSLVENERGEQILQELVPVVEQILRPNLPGGAVRAGEKPHKINPGLPRQNADSPVP